MQITHQRGVAVGTLVAVASTTLGGLGTPFAHAGSNTWRNIAIGAGVLTGYGLLKHKRSLAVIGGVATGLSYLKYRKERKHEKRVAMARSQSYYAYRPAYHPAYRYNSASPYRYSSAPVRYHRSYSRSYYQPRHHVYHAYQRAAYPYHPALHHAAFMARTSSHRATTYRAIKPHHIAAIVAPVAALAAIPVAQHVLAARPAAHPVTAAAVVPVAPAAAVAPAVASTTAAAPASNSMLPYALGVLTSLLGVGLGFGLANAKRREAPVETHYAGFEPPHRAG